MATTNDTIPEWARDYAHALLLSACPDDMTRDFTVARALVRAWENGRTRGVAEGREDAAKVCEAESARHAKYVGTDNGACERTAAECAEAIRAGGA